MLATINDHSNGWLSNVKAFIKTQIRLTEIEINVSVVVTGFFFFVSYIGYWSFSTKLFPASVSFESLTTILQRGQYFESLNIVSLQDLQIIVFSPSS